MRKLTKEEVEVIEKYNIQFKEEGGYILDFHTDNDLSVDKILHLQINGTWYCILKSENYKPFLMPILSFNKERQFKNAKVGEKYLMWSSEDDDKVYTTLKEIDKGSDTPFISEKGNKYKHIKVFSEF